MTTLFDMFFHMGLEACLVIMAILAARLAFVRAPRKYSYVLWLVVLFRLLCPVSFQSAFSLFSITGAPASLLPDGFGAAPMLQEEELLKQTAQRQVRAEQLADTEQAAGAGQAENVLPVREDMFALLWILGVIAMAGYSAARGLRLRRRLRESGSRQVFLDEGEIKGTLPAWLSRTQIWEADGLQTAFVTGALCPRIYLPAGLDRQTRGYILAHECMHLRRGDPIWRMLGFAALCIHWYNPFVWAAWIASGRDMEMSCDEAGVRSLGAHVKKGYSAALLSIASGQRSLPGKMLAFGEGETGSRIRNVLNYKKPAFWITAAATAGVVGLGVFLATDAPGMKDVEAASKKPEQRTITAKQGSGKKASKKTKSKAAKKQDSGQKTASSIYPAGSSIWKADLTHDGALETICFDTRQLQQSGVSDITVLAADGTELFSKPLSTSHTGWGMFALYHDAHGAYLFEYNPYLGQGSGSYSYRLFSLSDSGKIQVKDEGAVNFSAGMPYNAPDNDVDELMAFTDTVNSYWENATLLVTTDQTALQNLYDANGDAVAVRDGQNYYVCPDTQINPLHYIEKMQWTEMVLEGEEIKDTTDLRSKLKEINRVFAERREIVRKMEEEQG